MTTVEPAASLYQLVPELTARRGVLDASILIGYCWADEPRVGASVVVLGTDAAAVESGAAELAQTFWDMRQHFTFGMNTGEVDTCIELALQAQSHPVFISDAGDNVTGGGAGDVPYVLERLLHYPVTDAVMASIAVDECYLAGVGAQLELSLGGKLDPLHGQPLRLMGRVVRLGSLTQNNRCAVIRVKDIQIIITERRTAFTTPSMFESLGINLESFRLVVVKLGYLFPDLMPVAAQALLAFSPGAINPDLTALRYQRIRRPMFPLDSTFKWFASDTKIS
jgi:microcystin degradation protein MlrC